MQHILGIIIWVELVCYIAGPENISASEEAVLFSTANQWHYMEIVQKGNEIF